MAGPLDLTTLRSTFLNAPGGDLGKYAQATKNIESGGGNYGAVGPVTKDGHRALGAYQIMDFNVGPWTKKYLGRAMTPDEFLKDQAAQDAVYQGEFGRLVAQYGNPYDAASVWHSGRPLAEAQGASDGYTTTPDYVNQFAASLDGKPLTPHAARVSTMSEPPMTSTGIPQPKSIWDNVPFLGDAERRDRLSVALEGMTLHPNQGLMQVAANDLQQRGQDRRETAIANRTAAWLRSQGRDDLAALVEQQAIGGRDAVNLALVKDQKTTVMTGAQLRQQYGVTGEDISPNALYNVGADGQITKVGGGGVTVNSKSDPAPPPGYRNVYDASGNLTSQEPIPGGPADQKQQDAAEKEAGQNDQKVVAADSVLTAIDKVGQIVASGGWGTTGLAGAVAGQIPGSKAYDMKSLVSTITANIAIDKLQQMRANSPTGGSMGNISDRDMSLLQATVASLDTAQSRDQFLQNLQQVKELYTSILQKAQAYPNAAQFGFGPQATPGQTAPGGSPKLSPDAQKWLGVGGN